MHIALVLNGDIKGEFLTEFKKKHSVDYWIAVDGGIRHFTNNFSPDLFLGDMDSCVMKDEEFDIKQEDFERKHKNLEKLKKNQEMFWKERFCLSEEKMIKFPCEKDETDSELALQKALSIGASQVSILGWNGSRMDHVYGNISLLSYGLRYGIPIILEDKKNRVFLVKEDVTVLKDGFSYLSLFSYGEEVTGLTLRGFKYEVTDFTLQRGMVRGISNEMIKDEANICFKTGELLVMQSKEER